MSTISAVHLRPVPGQQADLKSIVLNADRFHEFGISAESVQIDQWIVLQRGAWCVTQIIHPTDLPPAPPEGPRVAHP